MKKGTRVRVKKTTDTGVIAEMPDFGGFIATLNKSYVVWDKPRGKNMVVSGTVNTSDLEAVK